MAVAATAVKVIPTRERIGHVAGTGLKGGLIGGLAVGILARMFGPTLGAIGGGILGGAVVGGPAGDVVAINGIMDGVLALFAGDSGRNSTNGVM